MENDAPNTEVIEQKKKSMKNSCKGKKGGPENGHHKYRGVRQRTWGKWVAEISEPRNKTRLWLGSFSTAFEAAVAYDKAAKVFHGPRARYNIGGKDSVSNTGVTEEEERSLMLKLYETQRAQTTRQTECAGSPIEDDMASPLGEVYDTPDIVGFDGYEHHVRIPSKYFGAHNDELNETIIFEPPSCSSSSSQMRSQEVSGDEDWLQNQFDSLEMPDATGRCNKKSTMESRFPEQLSNPISLDTTDQFSSSPFSSSLPSFDRSYTMRSISSPYPRLLSPSHFQLHSSYSEKDASTQMSSFRKSFETTVSNPFMTARESNFVDNVHQTPLHLKFMENHRIPQSDRIQEIPHNRNQPTASPTNQTSPVILDNEMSKFISQLLAKN